MVVESVYRKNPIVITEDATIRDAIKLFVEKHSNGVLVVDKNEELIGIVSLQDIIGSLVPSEMQERLNLTHAMHKEGFLEELTKETGERSVKEVMRKTYMTATLATDILEIAADFLHNDLYIIPVIEEGKLVGVITRSEIKKVLAEIL